MEVSYWHHPSRPRAIINAEVFATKEAARAFVTARVGQRSGVKYKIAPRHIRVANLVLDVWTLIVEQQT